MSSSYNHLSNGKAKTCKTIVKRFIKKCFETNAEIYMALLQIRSVNRQTIGILPKFNRQPVFCDNIEINIIAIIDRQLQGSPDIDIHKSIPFPPTGSTVTVQQGHGGP